MNRDELRLAIRRAADMVNSQFVTDKEIDLMIDSSVGALYDILCQQYGDEYWSTVTWIQVSPGTNSQIAWPKLQTTAASPDRGYPSAYALPDDFVRLVRAEFLVGTVTRQSATMGSVGGVHWTAADNTWALSASDKTAYPMHRIETAGQRIDMQPREWTQTHVGYRLRHGPAWALQASGVDGVTILYERAYVMGSLIEFLPVPAGSYAVQITYVPEATLLPNHPFPNYLIYDCAALCLEKQQSDSSTLRALQQREVNRIEQYSRTPDAANPPMVVDVYGSNRIPRGRGYPWP